MQDIYAHAVKLLRRRDYSTHTLRLKLEERFGKAPEDVIGSLTERRFLDDRRFAETFVRNRLRQGRPRLEAALKRHGITAQIIQDVMEGQNWPSTEEIVKAKMKSLKIEVPLSERDARRLFRAAERLGCDTEAVCQELERLL